MKYLEENVAAFSIALSREELQLLEDAVSSSEVRRMLPSRARCAHNMSLLCYLHRGRYLAAAALPLIRWAWRALALCVSSETAANQQSLAVDSSVG